MPPQAPDLGPGELQSPDGSAFLLSTEDWSAIQAYVQQAHQYQFPQDLYAWNHPVFDGEGIGFCLLEAKSTILTLQAHCWAWSLSTYPGIINLAQDIYNYGSQVPQNYQPLAQLIPALTNNPTSDQVQQFQSIVGALNSQVGGFSQKAQAIALAVADFNAQCAADKIALDKVIADVNQLRSETDLFGADEVIDQIYNLPQLTSLDRVLDASQLSSAVEKIYGRWQALNSDLTDLQGTVSSVGTDNQWLLGIDFQTAESEWQMVAAEAHDFITDAQASSPA